MTSPVDVGHSPDLEKAMKSPASFFTKLRRRTRSLTTYPSSFITTHFNAYSADKPGETFNRVPTRLLEYFHYMCVVLTVLGFVFSVIGLVCDAYDRLPPAIGTVALTVIFVSLLIVVLIFLVPENVQGEKKEDGGG